VAERWITDASPLIVLAKVGQAELLLKIPDKLLVPDAVAREVLDGPPGDPARLLLEGGYAERRASIEIPQRLVTWGLGRGETGVLALAVAESSARAVLDDAAARKCAAALGVPVIGTLDVVARAKRMGRIESAAKVFRALLDQGFRIDRAILERTVEDLGEHR
jgi:predicted nucleic acid-binding protein